MSELLEAMVGQYLSCNGAAFVCPQYEVAHDAERQLGGASPDFVVLDFRNNDLLIVEVSGASSIEGLLSKVAERKTRWFEPVRSQLLFDGAINDDWPAPRFLGFVRRDCLDVARRRFPDLDVTFAALEDAAFGWAYWNDRQRGLPGTPSQRQSAGR